MKLYPLPTRQQKEAMDTAHRMRTALAGDLEEEDKAAAIKQMNAQMDQDLLVAAWSYLSSEERRAWKLYCKQG